MGFEPTITAGERPKTDALDRTATGTSVDEINIGNAASVSHHAMSVRYVLSKLRSDKNSLNLILIRIVPESKIYHLTIFYLEITVPITSLAVFSAYGIA